MVIDMLLRSPEPGDDMAFARYVGTLGGHGRNCVLPLDLGFVRCHHMANASGNPCIDMSSSHDNPSAFSTLLTEKNT